MSSATGTAAADPGALPAVLAHLAAVCQARLRDRGTEDVQPGRPGRYTITACLGSSELVMMFALRRRGWAPGRAGLIGDEELWGVRCSNLAEAMRLPGDHQGGTGTVLRGRPGRPATACWNTVLRA